MFDRKFGIELEIVGINGRDAAAALRRAGFACQFEGYNHDAPAQTSPDSLTGRLSAAYWTIATHPRCTSAQYAETLGVTQGRFRAYVAAIRQLGIAIESEDGVYWVVRGIFAVASQIRSATESATAHDETDTVFAGIPAAVERFYTARAAAFAA